MTTPWTRSPLARDDGWAVADPRCADLDMAAMGDVVAMLAADRHDDFLALLVARGGRLAFEAYFNGHQAESLHDIRSAGKSFTASLIGIAADRGDIPGLDAAVLAFFAKLAPFRYAGRWKDAIRVRHLLMMKSGLAADDDVAASPGRENAMLAADDWLRFALDLPMSAPPGTQWAYAGVNTLLLAGVLEAATERRVVDYAVDHLFDPLEITTFHWQSAPHGLAAGQGFLSLSGRDMLKLGQLYLDGGTWRGRRLVSDRWVAAASVSHVDLPDPRHAGYGYQWWRTTAGGSGQTFDVFFASGNGGNKIFVVPALDMVIGTLSAAYNRPYMHSRSHNVLSAVIEAAIPR